MINSNNFNYLILFLYIGLWSSIGSDPYNFLFIFENPNNLISIISKISLKEIINFFRAFFPLFCLLLCLFIIFKYKLFTKQKKFIYILLVIQIIQIVTTFFSKDSIMSNFEDPIDHVGRYHWTISSIASILLFMIASKLKNFDKKKIFYISIFFLALMVCWFSVKNISDFYSMNIRTSLYNLNVLRESAFFLGHQMPRVTGLSRSIIFLYVIIFFINLNSKNKFKFLNYVLLIILGSFIFLFQSKFAVISFIIINFIFFFNFTNKVKGTKIILILLIAQILLFYTISNSRIIFNKIDTDFFVFDSKDNLNKDQNKVRHFRKFADLQKKGMQHFEHIVFSGRIELWKKSTDYIKARPILGYGSMSDRAIINQKKLKNNDLINPISNAFLYALMSGGIFSLILFFYFWFNIREKIFNIFKIQDMSNNEKKIGTIIIFLIGLRCLVENSIMLFGVDYLLLLNSLYLTEKK